MKKILYVASTYGHILSFHLPYIKRLQEKGHIVHIAAACADTASAESDFKLINIPFEKKMLSASNFKCIYCLAKLLSKEHYDIVSVHTSLAAFFVRLAVLFALPLKVKPTVINTVHGYLFDAQTPFVKRILLVGAEKLTKPATNHLVVMNKEDYVIAKKHRLYKDSLSMIPGMGINTKRFSQNSFSKLNRLAEREKMGFGPKDKVLIYAAEFSKRKNQQMLIDAMKALPANVKLLLAGRGEQLAACKTLAKELDLGVTYQTQAQGRVLFAGHVNNLDYYYFIADICVSSSRSEGLPFNIMEAMAMGLPVIATKVKGHTDLVENEVNGYLYEFDDSDGFSNKVLQLLNDDSDRLGQMSEANISKAQTYSLENVIDEVLSVYG